MNSNSAIKERNERHKKPKIEFAPSLSLTWRYTGGQRVGIWVCISLSVLFAINQYIERWSDV
jgi:hypothetical protein